MVIGPFETFQWNLHQNTDIVTDENAIENVVCNMVAILSRPQYVDKQWIWLITTLAAPLIDDFVSP